MSTVKGNEEAINQKKAVAGELTQCGVQRLHPGPLPVIGLGPAHLLDLAELGGAAVGHLVLGAPPD